MDRIIIKLLDNPDYPQLKMKYVGAKEYCTPKEGKDGKTLTGFDELAYDILQIENTKEREDLQKKIKKERTELERLLGVDLSPTSQFWKDYFVVLDDEETELDPANSKDRIKERFLVANFYVAPSFEAIEDDDRYQNCIFYLFRVEEEITKSAERSKDEDKVKATLYNLSEKNPEKLKLIASYILGGTTNTTGLSPDAAYTKLRSFVETADAKKRKTNIKVFLDAESKTVEELQIKIVLDKAIKKNIVSKNNGVFRRGEVILGNSYDEALEYLSSPAQSGEFNSLQKQAEKN